jgi:galactose mutarotase-like enzyme
MAQFMKFPTERERVIRSGDTSVGVIPELSLVSQFQVNSWEVLYRPAETGNVKRWGLPVMIPNFSRLKDGIFKEKGTTLPIHGFGRNLPWTLTSHEETSISIQLASSDATRHDYPYEFLFTVTVSVSENELLYVLTMENKGDETMPIAPGFHPYFTVAQEEKPNMVVDSLPGFNVHDFQWAVKPPDNPYTFPHSVTVQIPQHGTLTIEEVPEGNDYKLKNMQVWSEPADKPDHNFVCFEPIVTPEDGLNRPNDRLNIAPHASQSIRLRLTAKPL